jgi:nitric oxide reductase activation protein
MKRMSLAAVSAAFLGWAMVAGTPGHCQQGRNSVQQQQQGPSTGDTPVTTNLPGMGADETARDRTARMEQDLERARNSERQKKLIADTERLLSLANELKVDVDKSNKDMLSMDVIKKADEIEKLAHSVKEKMKGT